MKLSYQGWSNISSYTYPSGNFQTLGSNWRWLWPLKSILLETNLHLLEHQKVLRGGFEKDGQIRPPYCEQISSFFTKNSLVLKGYLPYAYRVYGEDTEWNPNGKFTQLHFWDRSLTDMEMEQFAESCQYQINQTSTYHNFLICL